MIYFILSFISVIVIGFIISWKNFKKLHKDDEDGVELTELSINAPTPTPLPEKKKRGRKPKTQS
jgi:hypothetical protein